MPDISIQEIESSTEDCSRNNCSEKAVFAISMPGGDDVFLCEACASECFSHLMDEMK